jgi:hypothetical protein
MFAVIEESFGASCSVAGVDEEIMGRGARSLVECKILFSSPLMPLGKLTIELFG